MWKNLATVAADEQNSPGLGDSPEKAAQTGRKLFNVVFATSEYKRPTETVNDNYQCKRQLSLPATSTQALEL